MHQVFTHDDIANVLRAVYVAQNPGQEGCRTLLALAVAFGLEQVLPPDVKRQSALVTVSEPVVLTAGEDYNAENTQPWDPPPEMSGDGWNGVY